MATLVRVGLSNELQFSNMVSEENQVPPSGVGRRLRLEDNRDQEPDVLDLSSLVVKLGHERVGRVVLDDRGVRPAGPADPEDVAPTSGPWRPPSPWWGTWSRSWGQHDAATYTGCTLAILPQPMVRAHLHVAVPGFRWRASPAGGHARGCSPGVPLSDPVGGPVRVLMVYSTGNLARVCRLGPGGLGALL